MKLTLASLVAVLCCFAPAVLTAASAPSPLLEMLATEHHSVIEGATGDSSAVATWLDDPGHVSLLSFDGDYSRLTGSELNVAARMVVGEEFFAHHADAYDFLIVFTGFPFDSDATAFHLGVRNGVEGIGLDLFDESASFGSDGVLGSYIDMGPLDQLETDPLDPDFESSLAILIHELFHQWGAYASLDTPGLPSDALLAPDGAHWSFLLDSDASVLYGNDWQDNGDGSFTSRDALRVVSPLDLYLAGFYAPEEVAPWLVIDNPEIDPGRLPEPNATIGGIAVTASITDVVAAEGPRIPAAADAPQALRAAFLMLMPVGQEPTEAELVALENLRSGLLSRFVALTGGRGRVEVQPLPVEEEGTGPGGVDGGEIRPVPASVLDALTWLRDAQSGEGFWEDRPATRVRESAVALTALSELDPLFNAAASLLAESWLELAAPDSSDLLARQAILFADTRGDSARSTLAERRNADDGWGLDLGFASNPFDTALVVSALADGGYASEVTAARAYLLAVQNADGGWSMSADGPSHIASTVAAVEALPGELAATQAAVSWLVSKQNLDGGFGDSPSTAHSTALALGALLDLEALAELGDDLPAAQNFLMTLQDVAGSWEGSVYTTALVARALQRLTLPNWQFDGSPIAEPAMPVDGETVGITAVIVNDGTAIAPATALRAFDGDPNSGGTLIGEQTVPALGPGQTVAIVLLWDTYDLPGAHELHFVLDPDQEAAEVSEADNRAALSLEVASAPSQAELAISPGGVTVTPVAPDRLPTTLSISATIANLGLSDALDLSVALYLGDPAAGVLLDETTLSVLERSAVVVNFSTELATPGATIYTVVADSQGTIDESDESNNSGTAAVSTTANVDLAIDDVDLSVDRSPVFLGQDATFTVTVHNYGTTASASAELSYEVTDGVSSRTLPAPMVLIPAGSSVERTVLWRVDLTGDLVFSAEIDAGDLVPESDESNNRGELNFEALLPDQPNLTLGSGDFTVDLEPALEGSPLTLSATVHNTGPTDLDNVEVAFFDGDPVLGGLAIGSLVVLSSIPAGAAMIAQTVWASVPDATDRVLVVNADPANLIAEIDETDNSSFVELEVLSLPDLALAPALIEIDPPSPAPGQPATITVTVQNLGQQSVPAVTVRLLAGDAETGLPVATDQLVAVEGDASTEVVFDWTPETQSGVITLTADADPDDLIVESVESNNTASVLVGVQNSGFVISKPIFSPNGDGIADSTSLLFELESAQTVHVEVVDSVRGIVVRRHSGPELEAVAEGAFEWDGRSDQGHVVRDTAYSLRILDLEDAVLGEATATVDTNHSSLLPVIGGEFEATANLTCRANPEDYLIPASENWGYFNVVSRPTAEYPEGLHRSRLDGSVIERVIHDSWLGVTEFIDHFDVSPDGSHVAFRLLDANANNDTDELWVANSNGSGLFQLVTDDPAVPLGSSWQILGFSGSNLRLLIVATSGLVEYHLDGAPNPRVLVVPGSTYGDFSPDHTHLLLFDTARDTTALIELDTGTVTEIYASADIGASWSPDGSRLAVTSGRDIDLLIPTGELLETVSVPELLDGDGSRPFNSFAPLKVRWSAKSAELATIAGYLDPDSCFNQRVLWTLDLSTSEATERARSEPELPCQIEGSSETEAATGGPYEIDLTTSVSWDPTDRTLITSAKKVLNLDEDDSWRQLTIPGLRGKLSESGRYWVYESRDEAADTGHVCYSDPAALDDNFAIRSLMNLSVQLSAIRPPHSDGVELSGTASDLHFARRFLEWEDATDPENWHPLGTPATTPIVDELMTTWVPPYPGVFRVRLTAEDLAGNSESRERRIVSASSPPITGVEVSPELISPNGDALYDDTVISYDVQAPAVVTISILDDGGQLQRSFERSHPSGGVGEQIAWDGRDESGLFVADGDYQIFVNLFEFPLTVDTMSPDAFIGIVSGQSDGSMVTLYGALDAHPGGELFERGAGAEPSQWLPLPSGCQAGPPSPLFPGQLECDRPEDWVGYRFRLTATDAVANATSVETPLPDGALWITGFGAHRLDPETGLFAPLSDPLTLHELEQGPVRFAVTDLVIEPLLQVLVQFRVQPEAGTDPPWAEIQLTEFYAPGSTVPVTGPLDPFFEVVWDQLQLQPDQDYELRLKALDASLMEQFSNIVTEHVSAANERLSFGGVLERPYPLAVLLALAELDVNPDDASMVTGSSSVNHPLSDVEVHLSSTTDESYLIAKAFSPLVVEGEQFYFLVDPLLACHGYLGKITAILEDPSGAEIIESPQTGFAIPCMYAYLAIDYMQVGNCGSGPILDRQLTVVAHNYEPSVPLAELIVEGHASDGSVQELQRIADPTAETEYLVPLDTTAFAEGTLEISVQLINAQGEESERSLLLPIDRSPPVIDIEVPQPNARVCGVPKLPPEQGSYVFLTGSITDDLGAAFRLELGDGSDPTEWEKLAGTLFIDAEGEASSREFDFVPPGTAVMSGLEHGPLLGTISDRSGEVSLRLQVLDNGGHLVCEQRPFILDSTVEGVQLNLSSSVFSPNGDEVLDVAGISLFSPLEPATVTVEIYPGHLDPDTAQPLITGPLTRILGSQLAVDSLVTLDWYGLDDNGVPAPDGSYLVLSNWADACPNERLLFDTLVLHTVPPVVEITSPTSSTPLPIEVSVFGSVDGFGASWLLEFAGVGAPDDWIAIESGEGDQTATWLADWNTFGLDGGYLLRLRGIDLAGNEASHEVALNFADRTTLITYLEAVPSPFSPNDDGVRDSSALRFDLGEASVITLELLGGAGRLFADDESRDRGAYVESWDGLDDDGNPLPDGEYRVRLSAELASDPAVTQTEEIYATIDRISPLIELPGPGDGGFVRSSEHVFGSITDPLLESYSLALDGAEVDSGDSERIDHAFTPLDSYAEGEHTLLALASDLAGNETTVVQDFTIDDTAPQVSLSAPQANDLLGVANGPHEVSGQVLEAHLDLWQLELGSGTSPDSWTVLASSQEEADGIIANWDVSALADGQYVLRLTATDLAANSSTVAVPVIVDNAVPFVEITTPTADSWLVEPIEILGSATDDHLESYELAVAPRGTTEFSPFASGTAEVTSGILASWSALPVDGEWDLRLEAVDRVGQTATTVLPVRVDTHPPTAPAGLTATVVDRQDVALEWIGNSEPDVVGYHVYRDGSRITGGLVTTTSYLDADRLEKTYLYQLSATDEAGNESELSLAVEVTIDLTPPATFIFEPNDGARVSGLLPIDGTAYSATDFAEFRVYAIDQQGSSVLLRTSASPVQASLLTAWDTSNLPEEALFVLRLEADDVHGNTGVDEATVTVDNLPPAAPTGLSADAASDDVNVTWSTNSEPDLLGYLLFRDNELVNASGSIEDYRPYALTETHFDDLDLPDGTFEYVVYAIDAAGNLSPPSAPDSATLDNGPPHAVIYQPDDGSEFEDPLFVRADSEDDDVASVQFQLRPVGDPTWQDLGALLTVRPYDVLLDPGARVPPLIYGSYELQAVATDEGGTADPAPTPINVDYSDLTAPATVSNLETLVVAGDVALTWNPATEIDLEGYNLYRAIDGGIELLITPAPITETTYDDLALADALYSYRVTAVDSSTNESEASAAVEALVYTPKLDQPWTPTSALAIDVTGQAAVNATIDSEISNGSPSPLPPATSDDDGNFVLPTVALSAGSNLIDLRATDGDGNVSKDASVVIVKGPVPSAPTGLVAGVTGFSVDLSWNANPEPDVDGYRVFRDGSSVEAETVLDGLTATASSTFDPPSNAIDGDPATSWRLGPNSGEQWLEVIFPDRRQLIEIQLSWSLFNTTYELQLWTGSEWLTAFAGASDDDTLFRLPEAYRTDRLRVLLDAASTFSVTIDEIVPIEQPTTPTTGYLDVVPDGIYNYTVTAVNAFGFESTPSTPATVAVGDIIAPSPVTLTATLVNSWDAELVWTESPAADLASYTIYRNGTLVATWADLANRLYTDPALANGSYQYLVRAVDGVGNESADSNVEQITVAVEPPAPPENLVASAVPDGRAIDLVWNPPTGDPPAEYALLRALLAGGPYTEITTTSTTMATDVSIDYEIDYFYVVAARDATGNESPPSNEASAIVSITPPVVHYPGFPGRETTVEESQISIFGAGLPGLQVELRREVEVVGSTTATAADAARTPDFFDFPLESRLSPNGDRVWLRSASATEVYTFSSDSSVGVPGSPTPVRWNFDSSQLLYIEGGDTVRQFDVVAGTTLDLLTLDSAAAAIPSSTGPRWVVLGALGGVEGFFTIDGGVATLRVTVAVSEVTADSITWAPDERYLAYVRTGSDDQLEIVEVATGLVTAVTSAPTGSPSWAPGSQDLAFATVDATDVDQVWRYDLVTGGTDPVTTDGGQSPVWSSDGSRIGYWASDRLRVVTLDTGGSREIGPCGNGCSLQWVPSGHLLQAESSQSPLRWTLAGHFSFDAIGLAVGLNELTATQTETETEASSAPSAVMPVIRLGDLPDLALVESGLAVLPSVPEIGAPADFFATVNNIGSETSLPSEVVLVITGPEGFFLQLGPLALAPIAAGDSQQVTATATLGGPAGIYTLMASADPFASVPETDESNNIATRIFAVLDATGSSALAVSTDRPSYLANEDLEATVLIVHGGETIDAALAIDVEDTLGTTVAQLLDTVVSLEYGVPLTVPASWSTGSRFAGDYRVVAQLTSLDDQALASGVADFTIAASWQLEATLATDLASYRVGDIVGIEGQLTYPEGNTLLRGLEAETTLSDPTGAVVDSWLQPLGDLLPGADVSILYDWESAGAATGSYSLHLEVRDDLVVVVSADAVFLLSADSTTEGTLTLEPTAVPYPETFSAQYAITHHGPSPLVDVPVKIRLVDPITGALRAEQERLETLTPEEARTGSFIFESSPLGLGDALALLVIELIDNGGSLYEVALDAEGLQILDLTPPTVAVVAPEVDGFLGGDLRVLILAQDDLSAIDTVELSTDSGAWLPASPHDLSAGLYRRDLSQLAQGAHAVRARAFDVHGNSAITDEITFIVDTTPPSIAIDGVEDGGAYPLTATPVITITELHPGVDSIILNGDSFVSGTPITEPGSYLLDVDTEDLAGNLASEQLSFTVLPGTGGLSLIVNTVNDVDDGLCDTAHCSLREAILATHGDPALSTIGFDIPSIGSVVIQPRTALPPVLTPVAVDGSSQPGASCSPRQLLIGVDGSRLLDPADGLDLIADDISIRGLAISGFPGAAIRVSGSRGTVTCNHLGVDVAGEAAGNQSSGVAIDGTSQDTTIGGIQPIAGTCGGDCNWIAFNGGNGIALAATALNGHRFQQNRILNNAALAIDLGDDGPTWNDEAGDADDGPNGLLNFPALSRVSPAASSLVLVSYYGSPERTLEIEIYANDEVNADQLGARQDPPVGELDQFLGSAPLTTDAAGFGSVELSVPFDLTDRVVTALAADPATGSSSEASVAYLAHFTYALIADVRAFIAAGEGYLQWQTLSEAGTLGFEVMRKLDDRWQAVAHVVPALVGAPQGSRYQVAVDDLQIGVEQQFMLVEFGAADTRNVYGPYRVVAEESPEEVEFATAERQPHAAEISKASDDTADYSPSTVRARNAPTSTDTLTIAVAARGIVRLDAATIATTLGMTAADIVRLITSGRLSLSLEDRQVAWWRDDDGQTLFFMSEGDRPLSTAYNVYRLQARKRGTLAEIDSPPGLQIPADQVFWASALFSEQLIPATASALDPTEDYWFWHGLVAGNPTSGNVTVPFTLEELVAGTDGQFEISFYGATAVGPDEHRAEIYINDVLVAEDSWDGRGWHHLSVALSPGILEQENELRITAIEQPGIDLSIFFLDRFELSFNRHSRTSSGQLERPGPADQAWLKINGLPAAEVRILDTTTPDTPRVQVAYNVQQEGAQFTVSFRSRGAGHTYFVDSATLGEVVPLSIAAAPIWPDRTGADYVIVTPLAWLDALDPLLSLRESQGLTTAAIALEEVYDRLSYGIPNPAVFRQLLSHQSELGIEGVRFLVIAGVGTLDPLNRLGLGDDVVPTPLGASAHGLFAADALIADADGDGLADVPIGRIPATSRDQLEAYVAKILAYESQPDEPWMNTVLALADDRDGAASFTDVVRRWTELLPATITTATISLDDLDITAARTELFDTLALGVGSVHYVGHGGTTLLANEGLLTAGDASVLNQSPRLPFLSALTCIANRFDVPGLASVGGALTLDVDGGAIAVWSSTAVSQHGAATSLGESFARVVLAADHPTTIGEAIQQVYSQYLADGGTAEQMLFYSLLGDPALPIRTGNGGAP